MFQPVPGVVELQVRQKWISTQVQVLNTFYAKRIDGQPWDNTLVAGLAEAVKAQWSTSVRGLQMQDLRTDEIHARDLTEEFGAQATSPLGLAGLQAGENLPFNCAALVRIPTIGGGAPRRGRLFMAAGRPDDINGSIWTTSFQSSLAGAIDAVHNAIDTPGEIIAVRISRFQGNVMRPEGVAAQCGSSSVASVVASQRDRRPPL